MKRIIITTYTDVLCSWCWATEPAYRALETRFPDEIEFRYVYGGLVRSMADLNETGGGSMDIDVETANRKILGHWLEGVYLHHMPIRTEGFGLFTEDPETQSSYAQGIAFKAAQVSNPDLANRYLRRIREATLTEAKSTGKREVQIELAGELGLDIEKFTQALEDGTALRKFNGDLMLTQAQGVGVFPTFFIKTERAREGRISGFNRFEDFAEVIADLTDGDLQPSAAPWDEDELEYLFYKTPRLSREELFQAFDFDRREQVDEKVDGLVTDGRLVKKEVGSSYMVMKSRDF